MNIVKSYISPDSGPGKSARAGISEKPKKNGKTSEKPKRPSTSMLPENGIPLGSLSIGLPTPTRPVSSRHSSGRLSGISIPSENFDDMKAEITCNWIYGQQSQRAWLSNTGLDDGVVVKKGARSFTCYPLELAEHRGGFYDMVVLLNVRVSDPFVYKTSFWQSFQY
jgi:hypothetical protein